MRRSSESKTFELVNPLQTVTHTPGKPRDASRHSSSPDSVSSRESIGSAAGRTRSGSGSGSGILSVEQPEPAPASVRTLFPVAKPKGEFRDVEAGLGESKSDEDALPEEGVVALEVEKSVEPKVVPPWRKRCGYVGFLMFAGYQSLSVALGSAGKALLHFGVLFYPLAEFLNLKTEREYYALGLKLQLSALFLLFLVAIANFTLLTILNKDSSRRACFPLLTYNFSVNRIKFIFGGAGLAHFSLFSLSLLKEPLNPIVLLVIIGVASFIGATVSLLTIPNDLTRKPLRKNDFPIKLYKGRFNFIYSNGLNAIFASLKAADLGYFWNLCYETISGNGVIAGMSPLEKRIKLITLVCLGILASLIGCLRNKKPFFYHRVEQIHRLVLDVTVFTYLCTTVITLVNLAPTSSVKIKIILAVLVLTGSAISAYSIHHHNSYPGRRSPMSRIRVFTNRARVVSDPSGARPTDKVNAQFRPA